MSSVGLFSELEHHPLKALDRILPEGSGVIIHFPDGVRAEIGIAIDMDESEMQILDRFPSTVSDFSTADKERLRKSLTANDLYLSLLKQVDSSLATDSRLEARARSKGKTYRNNGRDSTMGCGCISGIAVALLVIGALSNVTSSGAGSFAALALGIAAGVATLLLFAKQSREKSDRISRYDNAVDDLSESIVAASDAVLSIGAKVQSIESDVNRLSELGLNTEPQTQILEAAVLAYFRACVEENKDVIMSDNHHAVIKGVPDEQVDNDEDLSWTRDQFLKAWDAFESARRSRDEQAETIAHLSSEIESERVVAEAKLRATRHRRESGD